MTNRDELAGALIPTLQRVKNVPLGGDLMPHAYAAVDVLQPLIWRQMHQPEADGEPDGMGGWNRTGERCATDGETWPCEFIRNLDDHEAAHP